MPQARSGYTLRWKGEHLGLTDGRWLRGDVLGALSRDDLVGFTVPAGRQTKTIGELFEVEGESSSCRTMHVIGLPPLPFIGAGMDGGVLVVHGDVGDDVGASMTGGQIFVQGSAGARVGGPNVGDRRGMQGGELVIQGDAGDYAGLLMRRGLIRIKGAVGISPGFGMLAGSLVLGVDFADGVDWPGLEMQRGSIVFTSRQSAAGKAEAEVGQVKADRARIDACIHLKFSGEFDVSAMPAVGMIAKRLRVLDEAAAGFDEKKSVEFLSPRRVRVWAGDCFELNRGEVMQWLY